MRLIITCKFAKTASKGASIPDTTDSDFRFGSHKLGGKYCSICAEGNGDKICVNVKS